MVYKVFILKIMIIVLSYVYLQNSIVAAFQHNPSWYPCQSTLNEKRKCKYHWCWEQSWKDDQKRTDRWHQITFELVCFRHSFGIVVGLLLYYIKRLECNILIYAIIKIWSYLVMFWGWLFHTQRRNVWNHFSSSHQVLINKVIETSQGNKWNHSRYQIPSHVVVKCGVIGIRYRVCKLLWMPDNLNPFFFCYIRFSSGAF